MSYTFPYMEGGSLISPYDVCNDEEGSLDISLPFFFLQGNRNLSFPRRLGIERSALSEARLFLFPFSKGVSFCVLGAHFMAFLEVRRVVPPSSYHADHPSEMDLFFFC